MEDNNQRAVMGRMIGEKLYDQMVTRRRESLLELCLPEILLWEQLTT